MVYIISPVIDFAMYEKCILKNKYLASGIIKKVLLDNTAHNENISILYNNFLDAVDADDDTWFIFCHEDFEFLADPVLYLDKADKNAVFGTFGARIIKTLNNIHYREYVGRIYDCNKNGENKRILGREFPDGLEVDTLDCQCLMVHASLVRKYDLRFDPILSFNLYVEDFCLNAIQHGIIVKVADMPCCHHSQIFDINDRQSFTQDNNYFTEKYKSSPLRAGICYCIGEGSDSIVSIPPHVVPAIKNS